MSRTVENKYRDIIYNSYISSGFRSEYNEKEYLMQKRYFINNYLEYLPKDKNARILDLGCGIGEFVGFCLEKEYSNVIGVDTSAENIEYCRKTYEGATFALVDMFDYLDENTSKDKFDCIIFNDVIEHLTKNEVIDVLGKIKANLNPGGNVIIKTPNMANPFVNTAGRYIDFTHETGFTEFSIKQCLRAIGFYKIIVKGTDIYVLNPVISILAKLVSKIVNIFLYLFSYLYGRKSLKIFEKDILAIAWKKVNLDIEEEENYA